MSIFTAIKEKIFGKPIETAPAPVALPTAAPVAAAAPAAPPPSLDEVLTAMAAKAGQPLNWQTSIVDLMKLVGMDSSLTNRKELATELGYSGDMNDSASMNIWLSGKVLEKLRAAL